MSEDVKLLPCPFCGSSQVSTDQTGPAEYDVTCFSCHAGTIACGPSSGYKEGAITAWNTRLAQTPPEDVQEAWKRVSDMAHGSQMTVIYSERMGASLPRQFCSDIKAILALTAASRQVVPEGWKLVPVEPTDKMTAVRERLMRGEG